MHLQYIPKVYHAYTIAKGKTAYNFTNVQNVYISSACQKYTQFICINKDYVQNVQCIMTLKCFQKIILNA